MTDYRLRLATATDADAICRIYNQGIEDRLATLETERRTPEERRQWLAARGPRHPVIVAETSEGVVGWGSLNPFSARQAYRFVADFSVYVERGWRGKGVGRALIEGVYEAARAAGSPRVYWMTHETNETAMALYDKVAEKSGFLVYRKMV